MKGAGVLIHQFLSFTGGLLLGESVPACSTHGQEGSDLPEKVLWLRDADFAVRSMLEHKEIARFKDMDSGVLLNV